MLADCLFLIDEKAAAARGPRRASGRETGLQGYRATSGSPLRLILCCAVVVFDEFFSGGLVLR